MYHPGSCEGKEGFLLNGTMEKSEWLIGEEVNGLSVLGFCGLKLLTENSA